MKQTMKSDVIDRSPTWRMAFHVSGENLTTHNDGKRWWKRKSKIAKPFEISDIKNVHGLVEADDNAPVIIHLAVVELKDGRWVFVNALFNAQDQSWTGEQVRCWNKKTLMSKGLQTLAIQALNLEHLL